METKSVNIKAGAEVLSSCESRMMQLGIPPNHSSIIRIALAMFMAASPEDIRARSEADAPLRHRGRPKRA